MSIGKSSIARAAAANSATVTQKPQDTKNELYCVKSFQTDSIKTLKAQETYNEDDIQKIRHSIEKRGVLLPVLVAATKKDVWLIDGYRRFFAAKQLGIPQMDAVVISAENKAEANKLYKELNFAELLKKDNLREEKFKVIAASNREMPTYLL